MFKWIGKKITEGALKSAPRELLEGIFEMVKKPPKIAIEAWNSLSPEDKELLKQAAISGARLAARAIIAADKGGKMEF